MGLFNLGGSSSGSGGSGSTALPTLVGDGFVTHHNGQWAVAEIEGAYPARVDSPGAQGGNPLVQVRPWLGHARDLDLGTTGDKFIRIEPFMSAIREIMLGLATDTPAGCVASIWTGPNKTGDNLATFTAAQLATLTSFKVVVQRKLDDAPRYADYIYLNVETASTTPAAVSVFVDGRIMIPTEDKGLAPP